MPVNYTADTRKLQARAYLYTNTNNTLITTFYDGLLGFEVQRVAEDTKFFGMVVCQRLNVKLRPTTTELLTSRNFQIGISGADGEEEFNFPKFYISQVNTDEQTGEKSITCYDWIKQTETATFNDLNITAPYTFGDILTAIASRYGAETQYINISNSIIDTNFPTGANLEGKEKLKDCLKWIAEYMGAVIYINDANNLIIRRLNKDGDANWIIGQSNQYALKSGDTKRLGKVINVTELGDNVEAHTTETGSTQVIIENPFIAVKNPATVVNNLINVLGGITITPFEMEWRGNLNMKIGQKLQINTAEASISTFLLDETITYNGGLTSKMRWHWDTSKEGDESANPSTIGDAIYSTIAKVDKVNKRIDLAISDVQDSMETYIDTAIDEVNGDINTLRNRVQTNESNISQLTLDQNSITGRVSAVESTTTTIQTNLGACAGAGRNLFIAKNRQNNMYYKVSTDEIISWTHCILSDKIPVNGGQKIILQTWQPVIENVEDNNSIYYACIVYLDAQDNKLTYSGSSYYNEEYKVMVRTCPANTAYVYVYYHMSNQQPSVVNWNPYGECQIKVEVGEYPTVWTIAPEDTEQSFSTLTERVSSLELSADGINANVSSLQENVADVRSDLTEAITSTNTTINSIQQQVNAKVTATDVSIAISEALSDGVESVTTSTGYRFDKDGLTISKNNSDISTVIDNEGMVVSTQFEDVLTATNSGVNALNLTARNFLIIGTRSRLQDYGTNQTGIFWIGD